MTIHRSPTTKRLLDKWPDSCRFFCIRSSSGIFHDKLASRRDKFLYVIQFSNYLNAIKYIQFQIKLSNGDRQKT
nr:unnamed protein product [Callosobruchus analis]